MGSRGNAIQPLSADDSPSTSSPAAIGRRSGMPCSARPRPRLPPRSASGSAGGCGPAGGPAGGGGPADGASDRRRCQRGRCHADDRRGSRSSPHLAEARLIQRLAGFVVGKGSYMTPFLPETGIRAREGRPGHLTRNTGPASTGLRSGRQAPAAPAGQPRVCQPRRAMRSRQITGTPSHKYSKLCHLRYLNSYLPPPISDIMIREMAGSPPLLTLV
jgi:hypothetical protein